MERPDLYKGDGYDYTQAIRDMADGKGMYDKDYYASFAEATAPFKVLTVGVLAAMASI